MIREYLLCEAMHALGVPTTRALALVTTGEEVWREDVRPGAILTRVAASHIRVGTFEYFASRNDLVGVRALADYTIERHDPELLKAGLEASEVYLRFFESVCERQALLLAKWLSLGFIHGVMNTDNMAVSGETIDYGPCAFMENYDPDAVFSSIDRTGRYAYSNQVNIALWNLERLGESLRDLFDTQPGQAAEKVVQALLGFSARFESSWQELLAAKFGFDAPLESQEIELAQSFFKLMHEHDADFTLSFSALALALEGNLSRFEKAFRQNEEARKWLAAWLGTQRALGGEELRRANPTYIPRNHQVERAIRAAEDSSDFAPFFKLLDVLSKPFDERAELAEYTSPAQAHERVAQTFCGT